MAEPNPSRRPRVFLSHSRRDRGFVERVDSDLRHCQIEPWLDDVEIRHGKPWLEAIFREGIPACDAVLVYLTEASLESEMVRKEVDAGLIRQLSDASVAFLPYVKVESLRIHLRGDLQTLQVPEWNDANYHELLPRVVAEIWRAYLERTVGVAVQSERVRRLEAEAELRELRVEAEASVFSKAEESDFAFMVKRLSRPLVVDLYSTTPEGQKSEGRFVVDLFAVVAFLPDGTRGAYELYTMLSRLERDLAPRVDQLGTSVSARVVVDPTDELITLGLVQRVEKAVTPAPNRGFRSVLSSSYELVFTDKMHRFRYWLSYTGRMPVAIAAEPLASSDQAGVADAP